MLQVFSSSIKKWSQTWRDEVEDVDWGDESPERLIDDTNLGDYLVDDIEEPEQEPTEVTPQTPETYPETPTEPDYVGEIPTINEFLTPDATKEVVSYLLSLGHRRIGFVYGVGDHDLGLDRREPFQESMNAAGITVEPDLIIECGPTTEDGYIGAKKLLDLMPRPTAIIAINDLLAISTMRAAADLGMRVPDDLSVIGYDDIPIAKYLVPRLTTVTKDAYTAGKTAFEMLMARILNPDLPRQLTHLPAKLIVRESTGPAPV